MYKRLLSFVANMNAFRFLRQWAACDRGMVATEAAMIFPILLVLLLGTFDMGNGILANQKAIRSSQVAADLIARNRSVNDTQINEAIEAARLAFEPLATGTFGIDIVSVRFDDLGNPSIEWRETRNMSAVDDVLTRVAALAEPDGGVLLVAVNYTFEPLFAGFVVNEIDMQEVAFTRGRKVAVVARS